MPPSILARTGSPVTLVGVPLDGFLRGWEPAGTGVRKLCRLYCSTLNRRAARRCLEILGETGDGDAVTRAEALLPALADSTWTTPSLAFAHQVTLLDPDRASHAAPRAVEELERVADTEPPEPKLVPAGPVPDWVDGALRMFTADQRRRGGQFVDARAVSPDAETVDGCRRALWLLDRCYPEMSQTCRRLVRELRWFVGPVEADISVTLTQAFGAVFVVPSRSITVYETLVHETTHLELIARMAVDKLLANGQQRAPSPFGPDERPLTRVLHATLVAMRVVQALERCRDLLDPEERRIADERRASVVVNARNGLTILAEHAHWTTVGRDLFDSMRTDRAAVAAAPS